MNHTQILRKPLLTEKSNTLKTDRNIVCFEVDRHANKLQIKQAVEKMYGVTVNEVRTMNFLGKVKVRNTKKGPVTGRVNKHKKAIVSLKQGDTIDFYSSI